MVKNDQQRYLLIGKEDKKKTLAGLLEDAANEEVEIDELFLRKLRKMVRKAGEDNDFYGIDN